MKYYMPWEKQDYLGLLQDDLLDVTGTSEQLGKDAAHDADSGKVTWSTTWRK